MLNCYEWKDNIEIVVNPQDEHYLSFFQQGWDNKMVQKLYPPRTASTEIKNMTKALFYMMKNKIKDKIFRHDPPMTLAEYSKTHEIIHFE